MIRCTTKHVNSCQMNCHNKREQYKNLFHHQKWNVNHRSAKSLKVVVCMLWRCQDYYYYPRNTWYFLVHILTEQEAQSNEVEEIPCSISVKCPGPAVVSLMHWSGPTRLYRKASISEQKFFWISAGVLTAWAARNADGEKMYAMFAMAVLMISSGYDWS